MKILIVTPFFPPQNAVASLRPYSWAKYWGRLGHEITVYTTFCYGVFSKLNTNLDNVKVFEIPIPFIQNFLSSYSETKNINRKTINISIKRKIVNFIRNIFRYISDTTGCILSVRYPDLRDFWVKKIIKRVKNKLFDMVITTGCPYSVHRVGLALKKQNSNFFWIVDWRDLWTQNIFFRGIKLFHSYEKYLEKKIHNRCELITTVSIGLANSLKNITSTRIEVIFNGFDSEDYTKLLVTTRKKNRRYKIVYLGTFYYGFYNPRPLLIAFSELNKLKYISPNDIEIIFAGTNCDIREEINKFYLKDYYKYLGFIPREEALEIQYNADAVLFFSCDAMDGILSGKLFEYLSLSKEIWSIGTKEMTEADRLIKDANAGFFGGEDIEKIKLHIMDRVFGNNTFGKKNINFISSFERKKQAEKILSLVQ